MGLTRRRINNIISPAHTPDPAVTWHDGWYYAARSRIEVSRNNTDPPGLNCWHAAQDQVIITRSKRLEDVFTAPDATAVIINRRSPWGGSWGGVSVGMFQISYTPGASCPSSGFWAPALKHIDGRWFMFLTGHRPDIPGETNLVLENVKDDIMDPQAWVYRGLMDHQLPGLDGEPIVLPTDDPLAATVTLRDNGRTITGQLYYIYSHNEATYGGTQQLNLVRLQWDDSTFTEHDADLDTAVQYKRAFTATGEAAISFPTLDWEGRRCQGCGFSVNEGPTALYGPERTFILYSGSFCATKYYAIGMLEFGGVGDGFPYVWAKHPRPVFSGDVFDAAGKLAGVREDAFGIGHNQITVSPDLSEPWIVYHAKFRQSEGPDDREARAQRFAWRPDGRPDFTPGPAPRGAMVSAPSDAATRAVVCSEREFQGRFCVGLVPGVYREEDLLHKGVIPQRVRSMQLHGGVRVALYGPSSDGGTELLWTTEQDAADLPEDIRGGNVAVEVIAPPSAAVGREGPQEAVAVSVA